MNSPHSVLPVVRFSEREVLDESVSEEVVRELLEGTLSNLSHVREPSQNSIILLEKLTGFCSLLLNISANRALDENIRLSAIVCLKIAVTRYWRNDPPIVNDEKNEIKRRLLEEYFCEESDLVALQVSLLIGKIAEYDWPRMWPDLMRRLGEVSVRGEEGLEQLRGLMMLRYMIKSLTSRAGKGAKLSFNDEGRSLFVSLMNMWKEGGDEVLNQLSSFSRGECSSDDVISSRYHAEVAKASLKILSALIIYGFDNWSDDEVALEFFHLLLDRFPFTIQCAEHLSLNDTPMMYYIYSYNKVFGKLLVMAQEHESRQFLSIAEPALFFALDQIQKVNHINDTAVKCMTLIKSVVMGLGKIEDYKDNEGGNFLLSRVFSIDTICNLTQCLIQSYFTFTYDELEEWNDSPEQSYHNQINSSGAPDVPRSQAESLFLALIDQFPDIIVPFVLDIVKSSIKESIDATFLIEEYISSRGLLNSGESGNVGISHHHHQSLSKSENELIDSNSNHFIHFNPSSLPSISHYFSIDRILFRDAALHALCTANYQFFRHLNFCDFFVNALQREIHLVNRLILPKLGRLESDQDGIYESGGNGGNGGTNGNHSSSSSGHPPYLDELGRRGSFSSSFLSASSLPGSSPAGGVHAFGSSSISNNPLSSSSAASSTLISSSSSAAVASSSTSSSNQSSLVGLDHLMNNHLNMSHLHSNQFQSRFHQNSSSSSSSSNNIQSSEPFSSSFDYRTSILKRRICLLIGKWVTDISEEVRPMVYEEVVSIVKHAEDPQVALMAVWTLECLVNEMYFEPTIEFFEPMIDSVIVSMFYWLERCEMSESQLKILSSLGLVIEGIGEHVRPYAMKIIEMLMAMWEKTGSNQELILMQAALIRTFSKLVVSLSGSAVEYFEHLIPVIDYSTKVHHEGRHSGESGLLEDGIILWLSTLRSATEFSPLLLSLFSNIRSIIDGELTEVILKLCIKLVESYILLGQVDFLQQHVDDLAVIFSTWIGDVNDQVTNEIIRPIEILLMLYPSQMPSHFEPLLLKLLDLIHSNSESDVAMCYYVHFFNRLLLHNPDFFLSFLQRVQESFNNDHPDFINQFISQFTIDRIDQLGDIRRRKIAAMALSNLISSPLLISHPDLVALAVQTSIGVVCDEEAGPGPEYLVRPDETHLVADIYIPELNPNSILSHQLELLYSDDPVNKFSGKEFLLSHFQSAQESFPDAFNHMISLVEPLVLQSLQSVDDGDDGDDEDDDS